MRATVTVAVLGALLAGEARADPAIDAVTKCQVIVGYLDTHDSPHAREAFSW